MPSHTAGSHGFLWRAPVARLAGCALALLLAAPTRYPAAVLCAQTPAQASQPATAPASPASAPTAQSPTPPAAAKPAPASKPAPEPEVPPITEDQLRQLLIGKDLFLRGGYLDNNLEFNENGVLISHSGEGSYTLCAIRVTRVRLLKHKVEFDGERYGLHFLGALPGEDPTAAVDRVNITPKKKRVRITIDRELVVKEKPQKQPKQQKGGKKSVVPEAKPASPAARPAEAPVNPVPAPTAEPAANPEPGASSPAQTSANAPATAAAPSTNAASEPPAEATAPQPSQAPTAPASAAPDTATAAPSDDATDAAEAQAEIAQAPAAERPADAKSITTTHSQAHANQVLQTAIDHVFAEGLDARMMAAMPVYWKLYYEAAAWPPDATVLRQSAVDKKARLVSVIDPASNEYAQNHGVAGMAEYQVVVDADGKPGEIAIARPIGFGLDESAVESLRKATFEPAMKDGHAVPVTLDMIVEFRIYSKLTAEAAKPHPVQAPEQPTLPGPYSVQH